MADYLCATITFLDGSFHGRGDGGEPEWPPSPLRFFQALVAAAGNRWRDEMTDRAGPGLRWLEEQPAPEIVAPEPRRGGPYRLSVPNNAMDIVGRAWQRGGELSKDSNPATHRAMKTVRPMLVPEQEQVHFLWPMGTLKNSAALRTACEGVSAIGWGVDLVAASLREMSEADAAKLEGVRWVPTKGGRVSLRVPRAGTLAGLVARHEAFLGRVSDQVLSAVPPLSAYEVQGYCRADEAVPVPFAAFALLRPDNRGTAYFETTRGTRYVAGMMRHAVANAARDAGWSQERILHYVLGHDEGGGRSRGGLETRRLAYWPLPSVLHYGGGRRLSGIQRVMVSAPVGDEAEIAWLRRVMPGRELVDEDVKSGTAVLSLLPEDDWGVRQYAGESRMWSSVTPILLPGRDDGRPAKTEKLLRKSMEHAGWPAGGRLSWQEGGYWIGTEGARRYVLSRCHANPVRYHVRVEWDRAVAGPLALGAGRYGGFGVMAVDSREKGR